MIFYLKQKLLFFNKRSLVIVSWCTTKTSIFTFSKLQMNTRVLYISFLKLRTYFIDGTKINKQLNMAAWCESSAYENRDVLQMRIIIFVSAKTYVVGNTMWQNTTTRHSNGITQNICKENGTYDRVLMEQIYFIKVGAFLLCFWHFFCLFLRLHSRMKWQKVLQFHIIFSFSCLSVFTY